MISYKDFLKSKIQPPYFSKIYFFSSYLLPKDVFIVTYRVALTDYE